MCAFICVTRRIHMHSARLDFASVPCISEHVCLHMCHMTISYVWHDIFVTSYVYVWHSARLELSCVLDYKHIHMCHMTHFYVCHDLFVMHIGHICITLCASRICFNTPCTRSCDISHVYTTLSASRIRFNTCMYIRYMCCLHLYVYHNMIPHMCTQH